MEEIGLGHAKKLPSFVVYESSFTALVALVLGFAAILQPSNRTMIRLTLMNSDELSAIRRNSDELQDFGDISPKKTPQVSHGQAFVILGLPDPGPHLLKQVEALATKSMGCTQKYVCVYVLAVYMCTCYSCVSIEDEIVCIDIIHTCGILQIYIYMHVVNQSNPPSKRQNSKIILTQG